MSNHYSYETLQFAVTGYPRNARSYARAYVQSIEKMHTVKQREYTRTWLIRVLINCCHELLKRENDRT